MIPLLEQALIEKTGGALTKMIALNGAEVKSDGSACVMVTGTASRFRLRDVGELGERIQRFEPRHALTLGGLRPDLPDLVRLRVKRALNGEKRPDVIARTAENFCYRPGYPALVLLDLDTKGMPPEIADRLRRLGGFEAALRTVLPELGSIARLTRASTSAGLYRADTGERLSASNGIHLYVTIRNGTDGERFLRTLHTRLWLAGFGWLVIRRRRPAARTLDRRPGCCLARAFWCSRDRRSCCRRSHRTPRPGSQSPLTAAPSTPSLPVRH
jgi:hypothetical protein